MADEQYTVLLVHSTSHALRAEKALAKAGIGCKLIPVPRRISSDCGVCIRILRSDCEAGRQELEQAHVEIEGIHDI
jgi:hypothetical protein